MLTRKLVLDKLKWLNIISELLTNKFMLDSSKTNKSGKFKEQDKIIRRYHGEKLHTRILKNDKYRWICGGWIDMPSPTRC